jgi:hypothetical protein
MKKPIAIACVLLLLVIFIGVEQFKRTDRRESDVATHIGFDVPGPPGGPKIRTSTHSEAMADAPSHPDPISTTDDGVDQEKIDSVSPQSPSSAGNVASETKLSDMYYIRSRTVLGASEPSKESIARLSEAVKQVASGFGDTVIVFDLDGLTTSQSPFLSYASPRFDLTRAVEAAYSISTEKDAAAGPEK